jgi:hypothetical protein
LGGGIAFAYARRRASSPPETGLSEAERARLAEIVKGP